MQATEVLDAQGDLWSRLTEDPDFGAYVNAMLHDANLSDGTTAQLGTNLLGPDPSQATSVITRAVETAYAYRVSHDMSLLVEHAGDSLDEQDRFDPSLAPTGAGFVSFDRPIPVHDAAGNQMAIHFILWGPGQMTFSNGKVVSGTIGYMFNDIYRDPDDVWTNYWERIHDEMGDEAAERASKTIGRWATIGLILGVPGSIVGPKEVGPDQMVIDRVEEDGKTAVPGSNTLRYLHALWLLMNQTIAVVHEDNPSRPSRRRAKRAGLPGKVTIIKLRREEVGERHPGESHVEWQHRWLVRGHWRWQVCGKDHPLAQELEPGKWRCRIWINPFVKGPEGAPLIQSEKVYSLER